MVALRKESVDRNTQRRDFKALGLLSLSARRAWIEMAFCVDCLKSIWSLSARRAWIEMFDLPGCFFFLVALRKESVDRNFFDLSLIIRRCCRSPQGERG